MASATQAIYVPIKTDLAQFKAGLREAAGLAANAEKSLGGALSSTGSKATGAKSAIDSVSSATKSMGGIGSVATGLYAAGFTAIAAGAVGALSHIVQFGEDSVDAFLRGKNAALGLDTVIRAQLGSDAIPKAREEVEKLAGVLQGAMSKSDLEESLKSLVAAGYDIDTASSMIENMAYQASVARDSNYSLSEAVLTTIRGIKNGNSELTDAIGLSDNLSKIVENAGLSYGKYSNKTEEAAAQQAIANRFISEGGQYLDAFKVKMQGLEGLSARTASETTRLQENLGSLIAVALKPAKAVIADVTKALADLAEGMVKMRANHNLGPSFDQIWFKIRDHFKSAGHETEILTATLDDYGVSLEESSKGLDDFISKLMAQKGSNWQMQDEDAVQRLRAAYEQLQKTKEKPDTTPKTGGSGERKKYLLDLVELLEKSRAAIDETDRKFDDAEFHVKIAPSDYEKVKDQLEELRKTPDVAVSVSPTADGAVAVNIEPKTQAAQEAVHAFALSAKQELKHGLEATVQVDTSDASKKTKELKYSFASPSGDVAALAGSMKQLQDVWRSWSKDVDLNSDGLKDWHDQVMKVGSAIESLANIVDTVGRKMIALQQAELELAQVQTENITDMVGFIGDVTTAGLDDQIEELTDAYDQELEDLNDHKQDLIDAEQAYQDSLKALKDEYAAQHREEIDAQIAADFEALDAKYQSDLERMREQGISEDELNRISLEMLEALEQQKNDIRARYDESYRQDLESNNADLEKQGADHAAQTATQEQTLADQIAAIEKKKAADVKAAEKEKEEVKKKAAMIEWAYGFMVFQQEKELKKAQLRMEYGVSMMHNAAGIAQAFGTMGPVGAVIATAMAAGLMALETAAYNTSLQAVQSQQYPPPPVMEKGGVIQGPRHAQGGVMAVNKAGQVVAEVEGGEYVMPVDRTREYYPILEMMRSGGYRPQSFEAGGVIPLDFNRSSILNNYLPSQTTTTERTVNVTNHITIQPRDDYENFKERIYSDLLTEVENHA